MVGLILTSVFANEESDFVEAKRLIDSKIDCNQLSDDRLELIGDYIMEQMHPGEAHELMDQMMGGEGSARLRAIHISMAEQFYCGDKNYIGGGMMGSGGMMNMMGGGMMANGIMGYGMMGYGSGLLGVWSILYLLLLIGLIVLIAVIIYRLLKNPKPQKNK